MKRAPLIVASFTAALLTICLFEAASRGLNPPLEWDTQPAWWQSDSLADLGFWIAVPSLYLLHFGSPLGNDHGALVLSLGAFLTVAAVSLLVFFVAKALSYTLYRQTGR